MGRWVFYLNYSLILVDKQLLDHIGEITLNKLMD